MSSLFMARRSEGGDGLGGKILRGRRPVPSVSPYHRPEKPPPPPLHGQSGSGAWFSGLISGAGKLISSAFRSTSTSPASSSSYSLGEDISRSTDQDVDTDVSSKEPDELNQIEKESETVKDYTGRSLAIISEIEPKHAIEQLLMQETFSREECNKLTKIVQSRVIDISAEVGEDGIQKKILDRSVGNAIAFPEVCQSLNQTRKLPEAICYSSSSLNAFSPGSSGCQALTPDICNSVVMEERKWLEEKKLPSNSKFDFEYGPCTLNTNMLRYDFEGSPVDMAKSYMHSLPRKSPSLSNIGLKTTPCTGKDLYNDEAHYSSSSSKGLKRNSLACGSWDTLDEIRRIRMKSAKNLSDVFKLKLIDSSARGSEDETYKISSVAEEHVFVDSACLPATESLNASAKLSSKLWDKDLCSVIELKSPDEKAVEVIHPIRTCNTTSPASTSNAEEAAINEARSLHGTSSLTTLTPKCDFRLESEPQLCDPAVHISNKNQDAEEASQMKEQLGSMPVPCDSLISAWASVEHDGDRLDDLLKVEAKVMPLEIVSAPSGPDAVTNPDDVCTSRRPSSGVEENPLHQRMVSDSRPQDGNGKIQNEANAWINRVSADGPSVRLNRKPYVVSKEESYPTNSSKSDLAADISEATHELSTETMTGATALKINSNRGRSRKVTTKKSYVVSKEESNPTNSSKSDLAADISQATHELSTETMTGAPALKINSNRGRSRKVTTKKSVKQLLTEQQQDVNNTQGRKAVPRPRRGRGR